MKRDKGLAQVNKFRQLAILVLFLILYGVAGCSAPLPRPTSLNSPLPVSPLATPISPSVSILPGPIYPQFSKVLLLSTSHQDSERRIIAILTSPHTRNVSLLLNCGQIGADFPHCIGALPDGKVIPDADALDWSPDDTFAVICRGSFHDSPCQSYEVWDVLNAQKRATFEWPQFQWSPNEGHILFYLGTQDQVLVLDPDWLYQRFSNVCDRLSESK
jgi:hypothetical protein